MKKNSKDSPRESGGKDALTHGRGNALESNLYKKAKNSRHPLSQATVFALLAFIIMLALSLFQNNLARSATDSKRISNQSESQLAFFSAEIDDPIGQPARLIKALSKIDRRSYMDAYQNLLREECKSINFERILDQKFKELLKSACSMPLLYDLWKQHLATLVSKEGSGILLPENWEVPHLLGGLWEKERFLESAIEQSDNELILRALLLNHALKNSLSSVSRIFSEYWYGTSARQATQIIIPALKGSFDSYLYLKSIKEAKEAFSCGKFDSVCHDTKQWLNYFLAGSYYRLEKTNLGYDLGDIVRTLGGVQESHQYGVTALTRVRDVTFANLQLESSSWKPCEWLYFFKEYDDGVVKQGNATEWTLYPCEIKETEKDFKYVEDLRESLLSLKANHFSLHGQAMSDVCSERQTDWFRARFSESLASAFYHIVLLTEVVSIHDHLFKELNIEVNPFERVPFAADFEDPLVIRIQELSHQQAQCAHQQLTSLFKAQEVIEDDPKYRTPKP